MRFITIAELRRSSILGEGDEVLQVVDARKKREVGFFIPAALAEEFREYLSKVERRQKIEKLRRVAQAQRRDPIEEGAVDDGVA